MDALSQAQADKDSVIINPGRGAIGGLRSIKSTEGQRTFELSLVTVTEIKKKDNLTARAERQDGAGEPARILFPLWVPLGRSEPQPCPEELSPRDAVPPPQPALGGAPPPRVCGDSAGGDKERGWRGIRSEAGAQHGRDV